MLSNRQQHASSRPQVDEGLGRRGESHRQHDLTVLSALLILCVLYVLAISQRAPGTVIDTYTTSSLAGGSQQNGGRDKASCSAFDLARKRSASPLFSRDVCALRSRVHERSSQVFRSALPFFSPYHHHLSPGDTHTHSLQTLALFFL